MDEKLICLVVFEKENITDECILYCFVHKANIDSITGDPKPAAFQNTPKEGENLSSDWNKYSTAEETRVRIGRQYKFGKNEYKNPDDYYVLSFKVRNLRVLKPEQKVEHDPIYNSPEENGVPNNQAHSIIIGTKDVEIRMKLAHDPKWEIPPPRD